MWLCPLSFIYIDSKAKQNAKLIAVDLSWTDHYWFKLAKDS